MTIASFFSSFVVHADAPSSEEEPAKENSDADAEVVVEKADSEEVVEKVAPAEEAEEEEPEDVRVFKDPS